MTPGFAMPIRALAWDDEDEPEDYIRVLATHLSNHGIEVRVCKDEGEFIALLKNQKEEWTFVLTDLVKGDSPAAGEGDPQIGAAIARGVPEDIPVFLITRHFNRYDFNSLNIPARVVIRSKSTHAAWQAADIRDELARRGLFTKRKAFLIYGRDRTVPKARTVLRKHLERHEVEVVTISPDTLFSEINRGLIDRMQECAAIIAICTPDDRVETEDGETFYQPRQNVLYEIGMAAGLARGLDRLTILQKDGDTTHEQARLPSDLGGVISIRFTGAIKEVFGELDRRLATLGLDLE
jgi:predicted nucleotide-binding protein